MKRFTNKVAKEIASTSFGYMLDCVLGYSDSEYRFADSPEVFEQNFEDDLEGMGFTITAHKVEQIKIAYEKLKEGFEKTVRNKYYKD